MEGARCVDFFLQVSAFRSSWQGASRRRSRLINRSPAPPSTTTLLRGQSFVEGSCASCHAVGPTGASPFADATPFRDIVTRYPLSDLEEGFAEGLVTAHPAMPDYVFRASEIDDLIAYLQALKDMEARP